jgi:putative ABC transport system permease protein
LPVQKYATPAAQRQFVRLLDERLMASSLFTESAIGSTVPLQPFGASSRLVSTDGRQADSASLPRMTYMNAGPRFFETLRFPIARGRVLTSEDSRSGSEGVVINQRAATVLFGDVDPLGMRIRLTIPGATGDPTPRTATIVGVVPTVPDFLWPNRPGEPVVYAPLLSETAPVRGLSVIVRSSSKTAVAAALREQVRGLDADLPVHQIVTLEEMLSLTRSGARMVGSWFQTLALIAVVLACVGLYALTAHGVAQRTQEIGVRMALGAHPRQVSWLFVRHTLVLLGVGIGLGLAGALAFTRLLTSFLGGVDPRDPVTFVIVTLALTGVALLAALGPARRAARVDPVVALRAD